MTCGKQLLRWQASSGNQLPKGSRPDCFMGLDGLGMFGPKGDLPWVPNGQTGMSRVDGLDTRINYHQLTLEHICSERVDASNMQKNVFSGCRVCSCVQFCVRADRNSLIVTVFCWLPLREHPTLGLQQFLPANHSQMSHTWHETMVKLCPTVCRRVW